MLGYIEWFELNHAEVLRQINGDSWPFDDDEDDGGGFDIWDVRGWPVNAPYPSAIQWEDV